MASRTGTESRFGRRMILLAAAIAIAVFAYTAAWFYLAHMLEQRTAATLAAFNGNGVRAFCEEPEARGYPFRIGLFCRSVYYENGRGGISVRAGALRSAAQVYQPFRIVGELDGPATIRLPFAAALEARWENLRASTRLARPLPERLSAEGRQMVLSYEEGADAPLATAEAVQFHARPLGEDLEAAASFSALALDEQLTPGLPPLDGRMRMTLNDGLSLLADSSPDLRGQSGTIQELTVGIAGEKAGFALSGPVAIGSNGLIDADLAVRVDDPAAVGRFLAEIFPDARDEITTAAAAFSGLGDAPLQLRITRGRVFAGFIPLGRIPPL
ncbi:DUF2125 domain-containing protein [Chelativorans alearense]|uniref:DUF2125 domain-containing protein n=1 Tax=Chelativorans alearense TaxID=2681495 RepID=UPI0013D3C11B|nr:DUF2125 domain-containing protein [Chelativorans alearense]